MTITSKNIIDKSIFISMLFICLSIFLSPFFKGLSISTLIICLIFAYSTKSYKLKKSTTFDKHNVLLFLFYILYIIGLLYSYDKKEAFFDLEVKLPILIFPVLFFFIPKDFIYKRNLWYYAMVIILGCVIFILYRFSLGIIMAITNSLPLIPEISYCKLTVQPSYFALIASVALILTYILPLKELFNITSKTNNIIKSIFISIITIFFLFLNSTSGLLCITIAYISIIINTFIIEKRRKASLLPICIIVIFYILVFNVNSFNDRYKYYANVELKSEKKEGSQRKFIDLRAHKILSESSLFGSGTGDVKSTLSKFYKVNGANFDKYYNAHNQFLQTNIALGAVGLILFMFIFIMPFITMIKQKEYILITILVLLGTSFLFESMLEKQMGTFFFGLIYVLNSSFLKKDIVTA